MLPFWKKSATRQLPRMATMAGMITVAARASTAKTVMTMAILLRRRRYRLVAMPVTLSARFDTVRREGKPSGLELAGGVETELGSKLGELVVGAGQRHGLPQLGFGALWGGGPQLGLGLGFGETVFDLGFDLGQ